MYIEAYATFYQIMLIKIQTKDIVGPIRLKELNLGKLKSEYYVSSLE